jgi:hypothetical protein
MSPAQLFADVERASPSFRRVAAEHVADNGEVLPHVLMADLLRHVGSHFQATGVARPSRAEVEAVLAILDGAVQSGNEETANVVAVSFCEDIETESFFAELRPLLGLGLRRQLMDINAR